MIDFEPSNGKMLRRSVLPSSDLSRESRRRVVRIRPPRPPAPEPRYHADAQEETSAPAQSQPVDTENKKILGMRPKTILVVVLVVAIGIVGINMANRNRQMAAPPIE